MNVKAPDHLGEPDSGALRDAAQVLARRGVEGPCVPGQVAAVTGTVPDPGLAELGALNDLAWEVRMSDPGRSAALGQRALELAERLDPAHGVVAALRTLTLHDLFASRLRVALGRMNRALEILAVHPDLGLERVCKSFLGNAYQEMLNSDRATAMHLEALELARRMGHVDGEANALLNLGSVAFEGLNDAAGGVVYFRRALKVNARTVNFRARSGILHNLTEALLGQGLWLEARETALATVQAAQVSGVKLVEAQALDNVARTYAATGESRVAAGLHDDALAMLLAVGGEYPKALADVQLHRAQTLITLSRFGEAEVALHDTLQLLDAGEQGDAASESVRHADQRSAVHRTLTEVYRNTHQFEQALTHSEAAFTLKETFERQQSVRRTQGLMMQFDVERARSEAELYRLRTVELAGVNARLEQVAAERTEMLGRLQAQQETLERQVREDALSGLFNRRHAEALLTQAFGAYQSGGAAFTVAMIDIDHFKRVNDGHSHQVGDEVIRQVGALLKGHLREGDMVGRYGGEEFVMLLAGTSLEDARVAMERLRLKIQQHPWETVAAGLRVTASLGAAWCCGHPDWEKIVGAADEKLYEAKRTRNAVAV